MPSFFQSRLRESQTLYSHMVTEHSARVRFSLDINACPGALGNFIVLEYLEYPVSERNTTLLLPSVNKSKEPFNDAIVSILDQSKNVSAETFHS